MELQLKIVNTRELLREYIYLPQRLHKTYNYFVPPFYKDEWDFHDPEKNKQLFLSDRILFLAYNKNECVGRIMGIIYHPWNNKNNLKSARFYQLDCINHPSVAHELLAAIERWAHSQGMNEIIGSFGFSDKDPQGIQVEGHEFPPVIASVSHQPYLSTLVEREGYTKFKDCLSYQMTIPEVMPEFYAGIYHRILKNQKLRLIEFTKRNQLRPYFIPVMKLMNEAYRNIFGFVAMEEEDMIHLANQYLSVLDPHLVKVVANEHNEPVAFVIAMANISEGIKRARGKLFPFGFIPILLSMKKSTQLDLLLGAVAEKYRGRGLNVLLGISLMDTARKSGMKTMDSHLILEENRLMRAEIEKLGGRIYKRYRIYRKSL